MFRHISRRITKGAFLLALVIGQLGTSAALAVTFQPYNTNPGNWLQPQVLSQRQFAGFAVDADYASPLSAVMPGGGQYFDTIRAGALRSAYVRELTSFDGAVTVEVRLVECVNHVFAAGMARPIERLAVNPPLTAPDAAVSRRGTSDGSVELEVTFTRGRVAADVLVTTQKTPDSSAPDLGNTLGFLRKAADLQYELLLDSPDLTDRTSVSLTTLRTELYLYTVYAIIVLQLAAALLGGLRDRGARERLFHRVFPRSPKPIVGPLPYLLDVSALARRRRWRYRAGVAARNVVFLLFIAATFTLTSVKQILLMGLLAFCASVGELLLARLRRRTSFRAAYGGGALAANILGTTLAITIAGAAALLLFIPLVSNTVLPPGVTAEQSKHAVTLFESLGLLLVGVSDMVFRLSRRLSLISARKVVEHDRRPEILLLRSFLDDRLKIRAHRTGRQALVERMTLRRRDRFEEISAWSLWQFGPVVTLGEPGTRLPPLGAAREYFSNSDWQSAVDDKIQSSQMIVMGVGRTQSLFNEVYRIRHFGALSKTLFLFPPVALAEMDIRLKVLATALELDPEWLTAVFSSSRYPLALTFDNQGWPIAIGGEYRDDITYQAAIESAAKIVIDRERVEVDSPAAAVRQPGITGLALPLLVSPTPVEVRRKARKTRWAVAPWVGSLILAMISHVPSGSSVTPAVPVPGTPIAAVQARSLTSTGSGDLALLDANSNKLIREDQHGKVISAHQFTAPAVQVYAGGDLTYVATLSPDSVVALRWNGSSYEVAWSARLDSQTTEMVQVGNNLYVAVPATGKIIALGVVDGKRAGAVTVAPGAWSLVAYGAELVVGNLTDDTLTWLNVPSLKVDKVLEMDRSPAELRVAGDYLFSVSIENSSVTEINLKTRTATRQLALPRLNRAIVVSNTTIAVATYEQQPRLLFIDRNTLQVVGSLQLPSQINDMSLIQDSIVCSLPGNNEVTRVAFG